MPKRQARKVESHLEILIEHRIKWTYLVNLRTSSWRNTIVEQASTLSKLFGNRNLMNYAERVLPATYSKAVGLVLAAADPAAAGALKERIASGVLPSLDQLLATEDVAHWQDPRRARNQ